MAIDASHAAKYDGRTFSVEVLSTGEPATVLAAALSDYLDAVDCATEWLEREDPARTKVPSVAIFATTHGLREQVWAYPPASEDGAAVEPRRLVDVFGFDPVAWNPPVAEHNTVRGRPRERESRLGDDYVFDARAAAPGEVDSPPASEPLETRLRNGNWRRLREELGTAWGDRLSRWCLILGPVFLWLALTLSEPAYLVPFLAAGAALWSRRGRRAATVAADGVDDWF
jgi:hypothetical protein